ncbi:ninjurin-1-like isoform X2 [Ostrea edulis]|uniref:ninjurin-1-like isoform X2 n=1 Tax=Ostrea edulis TaxID=37623 RepID=UPI0024AF7D4E|nr:ninjurin-1-like isoform X2 [Ostrea edulis]
MPSKYSDDVALETNREETSEESPQNLANPGDNVPPEGRPRDSSEQDGPQQKSSSRNPFADRQNFVRQLCDTSLLAANVSQLRAVLDGSSTENIYFWPLIVMISLSILMHIGFGILMIQRWRKEREAEMEHRRNSSSVAGTPTPDSNVLAKQAKGTLCFCSPCLMVEKYDEISLFFMLLLVVLNVGIAGLGL